MQFLWEFIIRCSDYAKQECGATGLSQFHFWGWQLIIVAAAITLPLGITTSKEYAELEWPIDIAIAIVWISFGMNMFGTIIKRREKHMYVAIWFYIATWVTVTVLHVVNSIEIPVSFWKSYPVYAGVQDALVQWWYGHNAVAFFLNNSLSRFDVLLSSRKQQIDRSIPIDYRYYIFGL